MAIKVYKSSDLGAPPLSGQIGSLITFLDAVLQNGYGTVNVSSIVRTSATATVTTASAHGLSTGDSTLIAGATQAEYNGEFVVTVISPTVFTITVANSPATPATGGSITAKRAPVGYTKAFMGANKAAYRCNDLSSNRLYMRVLDDGGGTGGALEARVWCYESMTDVDTGTNVFPSAATSAYGYIWRKSSTADATPRTWTLISDGKIIYLIVQTANATLVPSNSDTNHCMGFGDVISYKPGDPWGTMLTGGTSQAANGSNPSGLFSCFNSITAPTTFASSMMLARDYTAIPGAKYVGLYGIGESTCLGSVAKISYPHAIDNGFYIAPVLITQASPALIRGRLPGVYEPLHGRVLNNLDIVENVQGLNGRKLLCVYGQQNSTTGCVMIDITGPWDA
jgi:hypothetical protein